MTGRSLTHHEALELLPAGFLDRARQLGPTPGSEAPAGPTGAEWVATLPRLLAALLADWGLVPAGHARSGTTAVVLPVARGGEQLALKVGWPQAATRDAALALRHWDGDGAVRLVAADPARGAALLERLDPGRDLATVPVDTACEVAGVLVGRLGRPAPPGLRRLSEQVARQVATLAGSEGLLPRRMVERAGHLAMELVADPACDQRLVHGDLRYGNVLAGEREPWLAVSPRPLAGHPAYEVQPLLRDRVGELGTGSAFRYQVRRRVEVVSDAAGLDEDLVRAWSYLRTAVQAGAATGGSPDVSLDVALLKALDG